MKPRTLSTGAILPTATTPLRVGSEGVVLATDRSAVEPLQIPLAPDPDPGPRPTLVDRDASSGARTQYLTRLVRVLMLSDALVALFAALLGLWLRFGDNGGAGGTFYALLTVVLPVLWVGALYLGRCYEHRFLSEGSDEFRRVFESAVRLFATVTIVLYAVHWDLARGYAIVVLPLITVGSLLVHLAGRRALLRAERRGSARQRVLVIGTERATAELVRNLRDQANAFEFVGALVETSRSPVIEDVPVVGRPGQAREVVDRLGVDTVAVAAWSTLTQQDLRRFAWELEGSDVDVLVTPNLTDVSGPRISVRPVGGMPLLHVEQPEFTGLRRVMKGGFDRGTALLALLLTWPLLLAVAIAVRLDSPGPALFRQTRVGRAGREFEMLKYRSMSTDAEHRLVDVTDLNVHESGPLFKVKDDPRITRVGAFLRRTSLDELPQLWNVLRGTMSLVGPRPPLPSEVAQYGDDVHRRLLVKPGLTGLWQVSGRSDLSWDDSVRLDLYYVENWSLFFDLGILARTVRAVFAGRGAY